MSPEQEMDLLVLANDRFLRSTVLSKEQPRQSESW
jgi:hypothetical protein